MAQSTPPSGDSLFVRVEHDLTLGAGRVQRFKARATSIGRRTVDVWLPEGYDGSEPHAVLYMHDGQMLFDSTRTWNGQEWTVDETMGRLIDAGTVEPAIVVGVWNRSERRAAEYFPEKALPYVEEPVRSRLRDQLDHPPMADAYLAFLTQELNPFIDRRFATRAGPTHTFVMGSSFGGLISLYALSEYPEVFGGAACLSTHWIGIFESNDEIPGAINQYLQANLPAPGTHRIYFDHGTETLDAHYPPYQDEIDETMRMKGYSAEDWTSRTFPGAAHTERAWARRLEVPLTFLLGR